MGSESILREKYRWNLVRITKMTIRILKFKNNLKQNILCITVILKILKQRILESNFFITQISSHLKRKGKGFGLMGNRMDGLIRNLNIKMNILKVNLVKIK